MERTYIVPLRREFLKAPKYKRTAKAMIALKQFIKKHMKAEVVVIGKHLNYEIWKHGPNNPPSKVSIKIVKEENKAIAELLNIPVKKERENKKRETKKTEKKEKVKEEKTEIKKTTKKKEEDKE